MARAEFLVKGFSGARIQSVADAAGVNSALLYKHFESKEKLFDEAIMAPMHDLLSARIDAVRALPPDPGGAAQRESTREFLAALLEMFVESIGALGVILFGDRDHARRFYAGHVRPLIEAAIDATRLNLNRWEHREFNIEIAVQSLFGTAFWLALDRSMHDGEDDLAEQVDAIMDITFHGIGGPAERL
ncbi:TetR/AcrR family transcriptional regulator [Mycobacterium sp. E1747]|uniref:TetR/AcrR family transcriptional regulator n=1 Tax=Mycobacterium sp. E1747 TaxID=1834128 RepID=UPI0007FBDF05|nr:TetR/AcrR family transcriptional regulator [Mycobacterium sp. E1747]OBH11162.1 hypothetical protein A5695_20360 [Mycobacterium sp. E1747]